MSEAGTRQAVDQEAILCRLCGQEAFMRLVLSERGFHILQCPLCGFVSTHPVPGDEELAAFYADHYFQRNREGKDYWEAPRRPVFAQLEAAIRRAGFPKEARILDVGAAYGAFLKYLKDQGYSRLTGLELSPEAARFMRERLQVGALCADPEATDLASGSFDVVTFIDTLEHVPRFKKALQEAGRLLRDRGLLLVRLPNMNFHLPKARFFTRLRRRPPYGFFTPPAHLNHFKPSCLALLLEEQGFKTLGCYNGAIDLNGSRKRILFLQGFRAVADVLRALSGGKFLVGNSMLMSAVKTRE